MIIEFNDTQSITLNLQNEDEPSTAWVSTLINGEFPDRSLGIDYSVVENATRLAGSELSPWSMMEYCVTCKFTLIFLGPTLIPILISNPNNAMY